MKKKLVTLMIFVCVACCAICLAACDTNDDVVEVEKVELDHSEITLTEGEYFTLIATITPSYANDQETDWSSSNTSVATVEYGSVIAVAEGVTTITVSTSNGKTATCIVTVEAKEPEPPTLYSVTFDANGGEFEDNKTVCVVEVEEFQTIPNVAATRGDKYVFTGWYKDEYHTKKWDADNDTVNEDITLYAGWKYINKYQSVMDALIAKIKAERQNDGEVTILSIFTQNGYLCFVEKDSTGVFSYKTDISDLETIVDNAELIAAIPNTALTALNNYNDAYTSDNNSYVADSLAYRFITDAESPNEAVIYSCVSEMEEDTEHITTGGPYYSCKIKAILVKTDGKVYDCSITVVSWTNTIEALINQALTKEFDEIATPLGNLADDFYAEYLKELEA